MGWGGVRREHLLSLTDSPLKTIYAFDFSPESGSISNRRVFIDLNLNPSIWFDSGSGRLYLVSYVGRLVYYPV